MANSVKTKSNVWKSIDENLPTILTAVSVCGVIFTGIYGVWAGMKVKKVLDNLPADADVVDKVKAILPYLIPVFAGMALSVACAIVANHENGKRYAALASVYAAGKIDVEDLKAKCQEIMSIREDGTKDPELGKEKMKTVHKEINEERAKKAAVELGMASSDQSIQYHDLENGSIGRTTLANFYRAVGEFNDQLSYLDENGYMTMEDFLLELNRDEEGNSDVQVVNIHNNQAFGPGVDTKSFNPQLDYEMGSNMQPVLTISYDYTTVDGRRAANRCLENYSY